MLAYCFPRILRSCRGVALAEQALENLARLGLHGQRRGGSAERNGARVAAAKIAIAGAAAAAAFDGDFERRQRRVLSDVRRGDLVDGGPAERILAGARMHAVQPRSGRDGVHRRADGGLVLQAADHGELLLEGRQRLQNRGEIEGGAFRLGRPMLHDRAVREVDEAHVRRGSGRRCGQRGARRNHGIQQRQRHGRAHAAQERAALEMFLGDEHSISL